ncbi:hypothetical protein [Polymorphum gilvum]|nr:hypothetical protein [Polymorphum gilvum]
MSMRVKGQEGRGRRMACDLVKTTAGAAIGLALGLVAAQADPVAMVLDRSENVTFAAFSELYPGDVVTLGETGHVDLLDYATCREVRITGGTVSATGDGLTVENGEERELRPGNCLGQKAAASDSKGLAVTMRGIVPENKVAASLMLRFDDDLKARFDTVLVSFAGGPPHEFPMDDRVLAEMPAWSAEGEEVPVEIFLKGKASDGTVELRQFTVDPLQVGRNTAVVVVK